MNPFYFSGPEFLFFYIVFTVIVLGGVVFWRRRAELPAAPPKLDLSDPYLIAYLRGGDAEVLRVATVTLIDRGLLKAEGTRLYRAEHASPNAVRRPVEQALLKKYASGGEAVWMFEDDGLKTACQEYERALKKVQLLPDASVNQARLRRLVVAALLLTGVGFTKIFLALSQGRTNVGFLIVLIVIALIVAAALSFPRLTESGKAMIADVKSLYSGLKDRAKTLKPGGASIEPMMLAAVFGVGALHGEGFTYANRLFPRATQADSGSSGGAACGSSCGSSCGGGGGCGGCGGCGG